MLLVVAIITFNSCKKEGCTDKNAINYSVKAKKDNGTCQFKEEVEEYILAKSINDGEYTIELYTESGAFTTGYNLLKIKLKNAAGSYVENASFTWMPMMHMMSMSHSCPTSAITKVSGASYYQGYLVFQMATNSSEYWDLTLNYTINGVEKNVTEVIVVNEATDRIVQTFTGSDGVKYILTMVEPKKPDVGTNDIKMLLYKMESMSNFSLVPNYAVKIDPRMPSMGNHTSPNNVNLTKGSDEFYYGKLNLTMSGFWRINLQVLDNADTVIKGEEITGSVEQSSIYFTIEF